MSEWEQTPLGDVLRQVKRPVAVADLDEVPWAGARWYAEGIYARPIEAASKVKTKTLNRLEHNDITYNRMWATKAAFGVVAENAAGCLVTGDFPTFIADAEKLEPAFMRAVFQTPAFQDAASARAVGTTERRRLKEPNFLSMRIALPSTREQRRIVDVMAAVDAQIEVLAAVAETSRHLLRCALADHFESAVGDKEPVFSLCTRVIGGIWGSPEGESEVDVLALGPRIYTPATTSFVTDGSPMRSFSSKQVEQRLVRPNDIILERSGGSPEQPVGRVVIAGEGLAPCVPTDFQRLLRPDVDKIEARYLFWRLQYDWNSALTRAFSRRTTGITNLSVKDYIAREIPVPSRHEQTALITVVDAIDVSVTATNAELDHLRTFRSTLLSALLNQEIEIPNSYDRVLERVS
jgi:type I restriction enzyme S subunit